MDTGEEKDTEDWCGHWSCGEGPCLYLGPDFGKFIFHKAGA